MFTIFWKILYNGIIYTNRLVVVQHEQCFLKKCLSWNISFAFNVDVSQYFIQYYQYKNGGLLNGLLILINCQLLPINNQKFIDIVSSIQNICFHLLQHFGNMLKLECSSEIVILGNYTEYKICVEQQLLIAKKFIHIY